MNTVTHSYDTSAVLPLFYFINSDTLECRFSVSKIFLGILMRKFPVQFSARTEGLKQVHGHYFILDSDVTPLMPYFFFPLLN